MNETKDILSETDIRKEMGITIERGNELIEIIRAITDSHCSNGGGRTSHVLLSIAGRKDLNNTEKALCTFVFASGSMGNTFECNSEINKEINKGIDEKIDIGMNIGINAECMVIGSGIGPGVLGKIEILSIIMAILFSEMRDMPKSTMKEFCSKMSKLFGKIAETGEVKLWR